MATWWFFKHTGHAPMKEQERAAMHGGPDGAAIVSDYSYWVGRNDNARYRECQTATALIYSPDDMINKRPRGKRPFVRGDEVWVFNAACLGKTAKSIRGAIEEFHKAGITLHIYTLEYSDEVREVNIYRMYMDLLGELATISKERSDVRKLTEDHKKSVRDMAKQAGPGRPKVAISYQSLPVKGQQLLEKYCQDSSYRKDDMYDDIQRHLGSDPLGRPYTHVGDNIIKRLVQECCDVLEARGMEVVRRRRKNFK